MAKVLLVDDNGSVLLTLAIALRRHGHIVSIAADGTAALTELRAGSFDALVSDVRMPGLTGPELAEKARALQPALRIILTSAYPSVESGAGIAAFMRKPIDIEQLHSVLSPPPSSSAVESAANSQDLARNSHRSPTFPQIERRREPRRPSIPMRTAHA
jgi:DNA-binding NtrC family response regulator